MESQINAYVQHLSGDIHRGKMRGGEREKMDLSNELNSKFLLHFVSAASGKTTRKIVFLHEKYKQQH